MLRKKILFLCVGNACRSQMAEAIARHAASDIIEAGSAGLFPFGSVPESTRAVLAESGVPCDGQTSKPLREADLLAADLIVNMTGRSSQSLFDDDALPVEDWNVGDPFGSDLEVYRRIRDEVDRRVCALAERLRALDVGTPAGTRAGPPAPRAAPKAEAESKEAACPAKPPAHRAKTI